MQIKILAPYSGRIDVLIVTCKNAINKRSNFLRIEEFMLITVIYTNGKYGIVEDIELEDLIYSNKINIFTFR